MRLMNFLKNNWIGCLVAFISGFTTTIVLEQLGWQHNFFAFLLAFMLIYIPLNIAVDLIKGLKG